MDTGARPAFKVWLETDEGYVFGPGVYSLLRKVKETGTLKEAATALGMSYRYAWGLVKKAEEKLKQPLLHSRKGGHKGGGAVLTEVGLQFLEEFQKLEETLSLLSMDEPKSGEHKSKNRVEGRVSKMVDEGQGIEITLTLKEDSNLRILASKEYVLDKKILPGDRLILEITFSTDGITKAEN